MVQPLLPAIATHGIAGGVAKAYDASIPTMMTTPGIQIELMPAVIDRAAVVTRVEVTILEERLVCTAAQIAKIRTMMIGDIPEMIGESVPDNQEVKPISAFVRALPIASVPAHMMSDGQEIPFDIASPIVSNGLCSTLMIQSKTTPISGGKAVPSPSNQSRKSKTGPLVTNNITRPGTTHKTMTKIKTAKMIFSANVISSLTFCIFDRSKFLRALISGLKKSLKEAIVNAKVNRPTGIATIMKRA